MQFSFFCRNSTIGELCQSVLTQVFLTPIEIQFYQGISYLGKALSISWKFIWLWQFLKGTNWKVESLFYAGLCQTFYCDWVHLFYIMVITPSVALVKNEVYINFTKQNLQLRKFRNLEVLSCIKRNRVLITWLFRQK